jgi:thiol-disulfide isomerase/thioredoxin
MKKRINTLDRLLIGNQAPNLVMQDTAFKLQSLHAVNAKYTMVVFWDPDCGHCKHEISDLISWYNEDASKYDVKIFAVCADTNMVKMTKKIHEYKIKAWINVDGPRSLTENYHELYDIISTPTIYLLDEQKNIIAKRLNAKQNIDFIKRDYDLKMKK